MSPFQQQQATTADWLNCSVEQMNAAHDPLHAALCQWLGVSSHSLACARGEMHDEGVAVMEEEAVLHVQRLAVAHGVGVPE